tara:strand:+ start:140462 stop:141040 length:579 start_codon:yes stop_codon:yes gene_type:complete
MKNTIFASILFLLVGVASTQASGKVSTMKVDVKSSKIDWLGKKVTGKHNGTVKLKSGEVVLDGDKIKSGNIVVDMTTIKVLDLQGEWAQKLVGHLNSGDFFKVGEFKTASFSITKANKTGKNTYKVEGNLKIKDISKKQTVTLKRKGNSFSGDLVFDRTDYNVKYGSGKFFTDLGDKMIHDKVSLGLDINLK